MANKYKACEVITQYHGYCCCNCVNQIQVNKHPCNTTLMLKGSITEPTGIFVCLAPTHWDKESIYLGIAFEKEHGMCEMYYPKEK